MSDFRGSARRQDRDLPEYGRIDLANAEKTRPRRQVYALHDYGIDEVAGGETVRGYHDANGGPVRTHLISVPSFRTDTSAQVLLSTLHRAEAGSVIVCSTDPRNDDGQRARLRNEGGAFLGAYIPYLDITVVSVDAGENWTLLAEYCLANGLDVHKVPFDDGNQFRGANEFPERALSFDDAARSPGGLSAYEVVSVNHLRDLAGEAPRVRSTAPGRVDVHLEAPSKSGNDYRTFLIADYAHNDDIYVPAASPLSTLTTPIGVNPGDALDAGFCLAQLALNTKVPALFVVDFENLTPDTPIVAAQLPNGSVLVGAGLPGVWEYVADAGASLHVVAYAPDINSVAANIYEAITNGLDLDDLPPYQAGKAPENVVAHVDPFGQLKWLADTDHAAIIHAAAADPNSKPIAARIAGRVYAAQAAEGIFGVPSLTSVAAERGSSGWETADGRSLRFSEFAVRDDSAADRFGLLRGPIGRAGSGADISVYESLQFVPEQFRPQRTLQTLDAAREGLNTPAATAASIE